MLQAGAQVAPEPELMSEYGVSRATVRQALAGLVAEGLLEIRRGLGTYVTARRFEHTIGGFYSFSREIERHGLVPGTRVLGLRTEPASTTWSRSRSGSRRERRSSRCAGCASPGRTRSSSRRATCRRHGSRAWRPSTSRRFACTRPSRIGYGCRPTRARETFEPILLTADEAALLDQRRGEPALRVDRIAFDQDDLPIEFCRSTVRGDRYRYSVELRDR